MAEDRPPDKSRAKRILLFAFKLLLSGGILFWLLSRLDLAQIAPLFGRISFFDVFFFFVLFASVTILKTLEWRLLLKAWNVDISFRHLGEWVLIGLFANNVLPGGIGGDVARLYGSTRVSGRLSDSLAVIIYDRLLGFAALVALGVVALSLWDAAGRSEFLRLIFLLVVLVIAGVFGIAFSRTVADVLQGMLGRIEALNRNRVWRGLKSLRLNRTQAPMFGAAAVVALVMQAVTVFAYVWVAWALDLPIGVLEMMIFVPLLYMAIVLPISINGIGIRESAFVLFFSGSRISEAEALSLSLTYFVLTVVFSMSGAILYLRHREWRDHVPAEKP